MWLSELKASLCPGLGVIPFGSFWKMNAAGGAPIIVLSTGSTLFHACVLMHLHCLDTNTQRESGRKVQMSNIEVAKVHGRHIKSRQLINLCRQFLILSGHALVPVPC